MTNLARPVRAVAVVVGLWLATNAVVAQTDPLRLYNEAHAREKALRAEMASAPASVAAPALVRRVRTLVVAYRDLARLFPASGIADKALWQGAMLSADAFWQWGHAEDQSAGLRAFEALSTSFPSSSLSRQAGSHAKRLGDARPTVSTAASLPPSRRPAAAAVALSADVTVDATRGAVAALPAQQQSRAAVPVVEAVAARPGLPAPAAAPAATPAAATLVAIRQDALPDALRVTLELDREVGFTTARLENPSRVFVDLKDTKAAEQVRDTVLAGSAGALNRIRVGRQPGGITRVVFDLAGAQRAGVYPLYAPYRVVVDLEPTAGATSSGRDGAPPALVLRATGGSPAGRVSAAGPAATSPSAPATAPVARVIPRKPASRVALRALAQPMALLRAAADSSAVAATAVPLESEGAESADEVIVATDTSAPAPLPAPAARTAKGDYSLSRQLGLGIARIVIDAGHGGRDPGAKVRGLSEAAFVLDIAQRLTRLLEAQPGVEVVRTREGDRFVSLDERTEMANRAGADLFVSIHANASANPKTRGVETYVLNFATNPSAEAVAARENAGSSRTMRQLPEIVQAIALNNKLDESRELARFVQDSLYSELRKRDPALRDLGVKQAPFMVLVGATMPAILTEVAFLTSQVDAPALRTEKYRQDVAEAIMRGITRYQQSLKKVPAVATQ